MSTMLDVNFGGKIIGVPEGLEKQGCNTLGKNSPEKFAGYFPEIRHTKIKMSTQIRSADPQDQQTHHQAMEPNYVRESEQ